MQDVPTRIYSTIDTYNHRKQLNFYIKQQFEHIN